MRKPTSRLLTGFAITQVLAAQALAQSQSDLGIEPEEELQEIVVTGTRVADRSALETAVPVDVISSESLRNLGCERGGAGALRVAALAQLSAPRAGRRQ